MNEFYEWVLSPSKFAGARGCPCCEEDPFEGKVYKDRGTDLHSYMEHPERPLTDLGDEDKEAVEFCREWDDQFDRLAGPFVFDAREMYIRRTNEHPVAKLDRVSVTEDGRVYVRDYKFGDGEVPAVEENDQMCSYVYTVVNEINHARETGSDRFFPPTLPEIQSVTGIIVQPAAVVPDQHDFALDDMPEILARLKEANDRVADPFRQPDPSNPQQCKRCRHAHRCPAITAAVAETTKRMQLLPMPEQFDPQALVSVRDRIIAQDLATVLEAWAKQIRKYNREYAESNGGTLGGVYNIVTRSNGYDCKDVPAFALELTKAGLLESPEQILDFVKVSKTSLVDALAEMSAEAKSAISETVKQAIEAHGEPRPPVVMFRRAGKKQAADAIELHEVPMIANPFKGD